jgi:hypothetical protein
MTTLETVQEIISIFSITHEDDIYLRKKLEDLEQKLINEIPVNQ